MGADAADPFGFALDRAEFPVRPELTPLFTATWEDVARPGSAWTGAQRVDIARVARAARRGTDVDGPTLREPAVEAAARVSAAPSSLSRSYVDSAVETLGERAYVELVGVVACVAAVDAFTQLVGAGLGALPEPAPGDPVPDGEVPGLKRRSAWVAMAGPPRPRFSLSAVPSSQATFNRILDAMYMSREQLHSADPVRGLGRSQMELVILGVSHSNECFY